ncbi:MULTISPECIES: SIS domain-containing protein [unclassified Leclercia]|uniref:SIS domain-containing protein n=1 Tax=unclassified Leclercia TaxID=2627398 RepID=UPI002072E6C5|nr:MULTISPECIES: SIS domain-containing protein [unclassified Leclercia]MCM5697019.1 SIS domain-containing protein [Leclercia sp. LTM01]MCM5701151.1 SIS domain-containing protein [Leclercia sp. LTM14]
MEENVIMPLSCTRQEIAGIEDLLARMQRKESEETVWAEFDFASLEQLYLVGSGDSYAVALIVERYLNERAIIACRAVQSLEFLNIPARFFSDNALVVVISASGRPSPAFDALYHALTSRARVVGMTNSPGSPFSRLTSHMIFTDAHKQGLPTQSSSATLFLLMSLAEKIGRVNGEFAGIEAEKLGSRWNAAEWQSWFLAHRDAFFSQKVVFLGSGASWGLAYMASNLMACGPQIEASYFHIEEYCHALRLNQAGRHHLVIMFPEKRGMNHYVNISS